MNPQNDKELNDLLDINAVSMKHSMLALRIHFQSLENDR